MPTHTPYLSVIVVFHHDNFGTKTLSGLMPNSTTHTHAIYTHSHCLQPAAGAELTPSSKLGTFTVLIPPTPRGLSLSLVGPILLL